MSPHEYMTKLDKEGTAYTVTYGLTGIQWVFSSVAINDHCGKWFNYSSDAGEVFVDFSNVTQFIVEKH